MKIIAVVYGTRPEAIKLAPVVRELKKYPEEFNVVVISTGQHTNLLSQAEQSLELIPNVRLYTEMGQDISINLSVITNSLSLEFDRLKPNLVIVQGDTTSALAGALAGHFKNIPVSHIEAGLRSGDKKAPFPEETNRILIDHVSDLLFPPTEISKQNLIHEGIGTNIYVVGNTIVDAFKSVDIGKLPIKLFPRPYALVTVHRRENFGLPLQNICSAIKKLADDGMDIILPVHSNPNVKQTIVNRLSDHPKIHLLPAVTYLEFLKLESMCKFLLSDSGGVQEEAVLHLKPILILRDVTERPEVVSSGLGTLVGTDTERIYTEAKRLMSTNSFLIKDMHPFGNGTSSFKIVTIIRKFLNNV
jgi:UDP-N-acetylglucosamine 2-epimerase (non-hydrolysing)